MSSFGLYLASVSAPIAQRVLTGLGIGTITYVGLDATFNVIKTEIITNWGALPSAVLTILTISGIGQAVGIVLGAISARVVMMQIKRLGLL